jgi:hypothetical protein
VRATADYYGGTATDEAPVFVTGAYQIYLPLVLRGP